jgi:hypothetical protein
VIIGYFLLVCCPIIIIPWFHVISVLVVRLFIVKEFPVFIFALAEFNVHFPCLVS